MHGIDYVLTSNHINSDNIGLAVQAVNNLQISLSTVNHFIAETIDVDIDETVPKIDDLEQARATLAFIVHTGLRKNVKKFSLSAFEDFRNRAKSIVREDVPNPQPITIYTNRTNDGQPPAISAIEKAQPNVDSSNPTPVATVAKPVTVSASPVATVVKAKRNRKVNPNSNLSRAKVLYANAYDKSRDAIVALFQKELGIEQGTATTYYYLAKKG